MTISIHQPNFFAWYPFFQKIEQADNFVIMTHCQYQKNGDQNRFTIENNRYTMSINNKLEEAIFEKKYVNFLNDWVRIKNKLPEFKSVLAQFDDCICENMSETNIKIILKIIDILKIKTNVVYDFETSLVGTDRLVEICEFYKAKTYISGSSGEKYLDLKKFKEKDISVVFQSESDKRKVPILYVLKEIL